MNYRKIISKGRSILEKHSILNADIDSELLLSISLNKSRTNILLNSEDKLNKIQINNYFKLINRRKKKNLFLSFLEEDFFGSMIL